MLDEKVHCHFYFVRKLNIKGICNKSLTRYHRRPHRHHQTTALDLVACHHIVCLKLHWIDQMGLMLSAPYALHALRLPMMYLDRVINRFDMVQWIFSYAYLD